MDGIFHKPNYSINNNVDGLGCNGCPAFRDSDVSGCTLLIEKYWDSYDIDNKNRMPEWERQGKKPNDARW